MRRKSPAVLLRARSRELADRAQAEMLRMREKVAAQSLALGIRAWSADRRRTTLVALSVTVLSGAGRGRDEEGWAQARAGLEVTTAELGVEYMNRDKHRTATLLLEWCLALHQLNVVEAIECQVKLADILSWLGMALHESHRIVRAGQCFAREADIRASEEDQPGELTARANLGRCALRMGREEDEAEGYRIASEAFAVELELAIELDDLESQGEAYSQRTSCLEEAGLRDDDTVEFIEAAVRFWKTTGSTHSDAAHQLVRACNQLAHCLVDRGEGERSWVPWHTAVVASRGLTCSCRHKALKGITDLLEELDDPVAMEAYALEGLEFTHTHWPEGDVGFNARLGKAVAELGRPYEGLRLTEGALRQAEAEAGADPADQKDVGMTLGLLGTLLNNHLERHEAAIEAIERSAEISRRLGDDESLANRLLNLGIVHENIGSRKHLEIARELLEEGLGVAARAAPRTDDDFAEMHYQLGLIHSRLDETEESLRRFEQAAGLFAQLGNYARQGNALLGLAEIPRVPADRAVAALTEAAQIAERSRNSVVEATALRRLSRIRRAAGLDEPAAAALKRGIGLVESVRARLAGPSERAALSDVQSALYADAANLAQARREPHRAFEYAEAGRARLTLDQRVAAVEGLEVDPEVSARRRQLAGAIGERARSLEEPAAESELEKLEIEWRSLEKKLITDSPRSGVRAHASIDSVWGVAKVQEQLLGPDSVLLEYVVGEEGCLLFAITRERFEVYRLKTDFVKLGGQVANLCAALVRRDGGYPFGRTLYRALLEPAERLIAGKRDVLICPDAALHRLPFELLLTEEHGLGPDGEPGFAGRWDELPYFLDGSRELRYIPSATTQGMLLAAERAEAPSFALDLLAMAAPLRSNGYSQTGDFEPLEFAREEVERVASSFPSERVEAIPATSEGEAAGAPASAFVERATGDFRFVHLATHATVNENNPWLAALVFEPTAGSTPTYLHASEVMDLYLAAACVTMSGCQTRGDVVSAGEGILGLASAFRQAGAHSVCATRWEVSDKTTVDLMRAFYAGLGSGQSPAHSLAVAQRELIETNFHPFYWAGFGIFG